MLGPIQVGPEAHAVVDWSRGNILAIVYLALAGSVTTFLSYYHLVKVMEATRLSLITLIFPIVAVALGLSMFQVRSCRAEPIETPSSGALTPPVPSNP